MQTTLKCNSIVGCIPNSCLSPSQPFRQALRLAWRVRVSVVYSGMEPLENFTPEELQQLDRNGHVTAKEIFRVLSPHRTKRKDKAIPKLDAQSTTQCKPDNFSSRDASVIRQAGTRLKELNPILYYIFSLQLDGALRISEVLSISPAKIDVLGNVLIHAGKGGITRIVTSADAREYLLACKEHSVYPFAEYNRFFVYRMYRKCGVFFQSEYSSKNSVTHALRHVNAAAAKKAGFEKSTITQRLGHRNPNTQKHYGTSKR